VNYLLVANLLFFWQQAVGSTEILLWQSLHSDEKATLLTLYTGPLFDERIDRLPSAQVEVPNTKISVG